MKRLPFIFALLSITKAFASEPIGLTQEEFKMYRHYVQAMEDPRVQAMKPEARKGAIAKDSHYKPKDLDAALAHAEAAGDFKAKCEANIKEALGATELKGRLAKIDVDVNEPHAVAYVQWLNESPDKLPYEASVAAALSASACPIASTVQVWAQDIGNPKVRVFEALISSSAAAKINVEKAKDFAQTRYLRLFEKLKSVANGDDLSVDTASAKP